MLDTAPGDQQYAQTYLRVRRLSEKLCAPLQLEDYVVQSMPDVSPTKWHLAHVTWFFETFLLADVAGYRTPDPGYDYLFNSYYNTIGPQHRRAERGLITRPGVAEVMDYRHHVDEHVLRLIEEGLTPRQQEVLRLGLNHEQQHQELVLMDIKHVFSRNPMSPAYREGLLPVREDAQPLTWTHFDGGQVDIGAGNDVRFCFDNERPRHVQTLVPFEIADRLITNGEFADFVEDGGYEDPQWWLSDGWHLLQEHGWDAPLYWRKSAAGEWLEFTLRGELPLDRARPVVHMSFYEASAFAAWSGARLPTEFEWETAAAKVSLGPHNLLDADRLHPDVPESTSGLRQLLGDVWEWTTSAYAAYPGFQPPLGALGEYNGKFMCNQQVLRGGCCVTPGDHIRTTYRNFFYPHMRWQFGGIRLAKDAI